MLISVFREWSPSSGRLALANVAGASKVRELITEIAKRRGKIPYHATDKTNIDLALWNMSLHIGVEIPIL